VIRVLVADDQALVRAGFSVLIDSDPGLEVVGEASNGAEAVDLARATRPDVVLMDIRMPVMDGPEATRQVLALDGADTIRVLMLTTFDLDEYVFGALKAGASGFLLKDTPPAALLAGIRTVAAGEALLSPSVTRQLIEEYVRRPARRPSPGRAHPGRAHRPRAGGARAGRPRAVERGDRPAPLREPGHGQDPRRPAADEARRTRPCPAHRDRLRERPGHPGPAALLVGGSGSGRLLVP
jgi:DNA-binding NarL/FixJ family response regulator